MSDLGSRLEVSGLRIFRLGKQRGSYAKLSINSPGMRNFIETLAFEIRLGELPYPLWPILPRASIPIPNS